MAPPIAGGHLWSLVKALQSLPCMGSQGDRNFVVRLLNDRLGPLQIDESPKTQPHILSIVEVCSRRPDGFDALWDIISELDQGISQLQAVERIIAEQRALALWPEEERNQVFALLSGMIFTDLVELYRQVAGASAPELPAQTTYREVFLTLETLNADANGLPKPIVFVEHLASRLRSELSIELRRWADRQASRLGVITELQAMRRASQTPPSGPPPNSPAYLVLLLRTAGLANDRLQLCHWTQLDLTDGWHPERGEDFFGSIEQVKHQVAALIELVETKWARHQPDIRIEVILSGDLLNLDVDRWSWEVDNPLPVPIGCRYAFAARSLERMQTGKWHRPWHARWSVLTGQLEETGSIVPESSRRAAAGEPLRGLIADFENDAKLVSLVLSAPPEAAATSGDEFAVGLRAGVPIIIWHRQDCDSEDFLSTVRELMHGDDPGSVLQRMRQIRTTAYESHAGHVGHHLVLLWDDPGRIVVPPDLGPPREASVA